jgi:hypothetical protein
MTTTLRAFNVRAIRCASIAILALVSLVALRQTASAAELSEQAKSLKVVPADAAYYSASLRLKEQFDIFLESNAYKRMMEIQLVQLAKGQIEFQWQAQSLPGVKAVREYIESDEGQQAIAVVKEMFADEMFVYGGNDMTEWLELLMEVSSMQSMARQDAAASGEEVDDVLQNRLLELFESRSDEFGVPTVVLGFRIKDAEKATEQLDVIHGHLRKLLDDKQPELAAHLQRDQIAGHEFLTLRVDGSMIPWEKAREQADDVSPEQFEKWRAVISKKTLAVAIGVIDEYVLVSIGESTDHLENFGQGESLAGHDAIKRLEEHAGERVVSISYLSEIVAKSFSSPEKTVQDVANSVEEGLESAEIDEELRKKVVKDIQELDLSKFMPSPGETSAIVFLTDRGYEAFQYQTGDQPMMDSSKPLEILNHIGGSPLLFVASRSNDTVEDYDAAVKWLTKTAGHLEEIAQSKAEPDDWARYMEYRDRVIELLHRLNKANRELLYPALEKNEGAIVLDASAESKRWFAQMPESPKELPMLEIGIVAGVSDPEKLKEGVKEYVAVAKEAMELAHEINPEEVPEIDLPKPEEREAEGDGDGKLFVFDFPEEWGIDEQIAPTAALSDAAAVLSSMPSTAERLLASTEPEIDTSIDLKRPAAMVMHFKFAELVQNVRPWIDYGLGVAMGTIKNDPPADEEEGDEESDEDAEDEEGDEEEAAEPNPIAFQMGFVMPQFYQFLDVISAFRSATSITYEADGVWITHSETHIEDLED